MTELKASTSYLPPPPDKQAHKKDVKASEGKGGEQKATNDFISTSSLVGFITVDSHLLPVVAIIVRNLKHAKGSEYLLSYSIQCATFDQKKSAFFKGTDKQSIILLKYVND